MRERLNERITGVLSPVVTPFRPDLSPDHPNPDISDGEELRRRQR